MPAPTEETVTITKAEYDALLQKLAVVKDFIKGVQDAQRPNRLAELVQKAVDVFDKIK